ncbi:MAG TPA: tRNA lysidine(34) synthetase TilS [Pirellulaceae bacterium]
MAPPAITGCDRRPGERSLHEQFEDALPHPPWQEMSVVAAVSGGADSVALLHLLRNHHASAGARSGSLIVAHFDHGQRPESVSTADFVGQLAVAWDLPCKIARYGAEARSTSVAPASEAQLRRARYRFLRGVAEEAGARYLMLAHTADDQAETVLHRILRGTGMRGLAGIPRQRPLGPAVTIFRPLLEVRRGELRMYLATMGLEFREDPTNQDQRYTRNRIRHTLMPLLQEKFNPQVVGALGKLSLIARETQETLEQLAQEVWTESVVAVRGHELILRRKPLHRVPGSIIREVLARAWREAEFQEVGMGYAEWSFLARMIQRGEPRYHQFPGSITGEITSDALILRRPESH